MYEKAIVAAKDQPEYEEYYYLANSNLCHRLATTKQREEAALAAGKEANDKADAFENRDSFRINYGFAMAQFARTDRELSDALVHLLQIHEQDLSREERVEINKYVAHFAQGLCQDIQKI